VRGIFQRQNSEVRFFPCPGKGVGTALLLLALEGERRELNSDGDGAGGGNRGAVAATASSSGTVTSNAAVIGVRGGKRRNRRLCGGVRAHVHPTLLAGGSGGKVDRAK
jgi:hypothetical protein